MNQDLIINVTASEVVLALLENKKLTELHRERPNNKYSVGDLYLGRVKKLVPGLNAAFVDVGYEKDAFLHYFDLGPQAASLQKYLRSSLSGRQRSGSLQNFKLEPDINKEGKIQQVIQSNQQILVQIAKEPISTKGPRISCELSLAGRFLVLVPFSDRISISTKIKEADERERLKRLIQSIRPKNFGVIIRTVAENKKVAELDADLKELYNRWNKAQKKLKRSNKPVKVLGELDRTSALLRDVLNPSFNSILVNDQKMFEEIRAFLRNIAPEKEKIVRHFRGKTPVFEFTGIEKQIKALFGKHVTMLSGAYLVIEHTEALHVIDVNSGNTAKSEDNQETNALRVNLEAADEIARQLRLRDMGGIIVIDFIDMQKSENRRKLHDRMTQVMKIDRAKHHVLAPSKFGLVQITRQRVRPEMDIETAEGCPCCSGTGKVQASILIEDEIENNVRFLMEKKFPDQITLVTHPFLNSHFSAGLMSRQVKWFLKYKRWVTLRPSSAYQFLEYRFLNGKGEEVEV